MSDASCPSAYLIRSFKYCLSPSANVFRLLDEPLRERVPWKIFGSWGALKNALKEWRADDGRLVESGLESWSVKLLRRDDARELSRDVAIGLACGLAEGRRAAGIRCVSIAAGGGRLLNRFPAALASACFSFSTFLAFFSCSFFSRSTRFFSFFFLLLPKSDQLGDTQISAAGTSSGRSPRSGPIEEGISFIGFRIGIVRAGSG